MVYAKYKLRGICIGHLWFASSNEDKTKVDILYLHGQKNRGGGYGTIQHTLITDLTEDEDQIYKRIRKNYRYEIRRAEKENIQLRFYSAREMNDNKALMSSFVETYNQMYVSKGMEAKFNKPLVEEYIKENAICFTIAFYNDEPLVFHSYIMDEHNVRFYYSASPFRVKKEVASIIGHMNKALHWFDIRTFRDKGIERYDWGGIADPQNPNGIDQFKMGFGGEEKDYYNIIQGITCIGKGAVLLSRIKNILSKR